MISEASYPVPGAKSSFDRLLQQCCNIVGATDTSSDSYTSAILVALDLWANSLALEEINEATVAFKEQRFEHSFISDSPQQKTKGHATELLTSIASLIRRHLKYRSFLVSVIQTAEKSIGNRLLGNHFSIVEERLLELHDQNFLRWLSHKLKFLFDENSSVKRLVSSVRMHHTRSSLQA